MREKLTKLVIFTGIAFLGIISLQVYWLNNSYQEKCSKLESSLSRAVLASQLSLLKTSRNKTPLLTIVDPSLKSRNHLQKAIRINDAVPPSKIFPTHIESPEITLNDYQKQISDRLKKEDINLTFKLALLDDTGNLLTKDISPALLKSIRLKSKPQQVAIIRGDDTLSGNLVVFIPKASNFLLHNVLQIAIVATVLILACIISLIYMITFFLKQKKISNIRKDFTNNMTHELKTPISSATVAIGMLKDESMSLESNQRQEYFQIAENALKRLSLLVDKVLKMAAFEKGEIKIMPQYFPVRSWIDNIVNPQMPVINAINAKLTITVYPDNLRFKADKATLSSVLQNLLDNSIKYADHDKDHISIQIDAWQGADDYFLAVQDNGIGIPFYHQERIFDKFFRVPTGDEHNTKGYGLGLSYVKEIVQLHGGNIELESTFHSGTRFKIRIPK